MSNRSVNVLVVDDDIAVSVAQIRDGLDHYDRFCVDVDKARRAFEFADRVQCRVDVDEVVEAELLATRAHSLGAGEGARDTKTAAPGH